MAFPFGFGSLLGPRWPRTAHRGPKGRPGSPTGLRPQGQPRTAHRDPRKGPGPPTEGPGAAQDRLQWCEDRPKTISRRPVCITTVNLSTMM